MRQDTLPKLNLQSLKLRDYRCFEAIDIDFHERLTVLVAANGAGKTSILDAIAVAFGPYIGAFDEAVGRNFEPGDIRQYRVRRTATHEMEYAPKGTQVVASGFIPGGTMDAVFSNRPATVWRRSLASPVKAKTTVREAKELVDYGKRMQEAVRTPGSDVLLPLIAYYGTGRLWQQKQRAETRNFQRKIPRTSRTVAYADSLDPASSYKSFVEWFRYWNFNAKDARITAQETGRDNGAAEFDGYIESVRRAVNGCLQPVGWKDIEYSFARDALVAHHDALGELPVELLSDGIRSMIGMVADIAFRATKLNGHLGARASSETPGIVLIDEVDMHLHPEWQQVVLQELIDAFPAMQFIVTTHSPQVLSTVTADCVRILRTGIDPDSGRAVAEVRKIELQTRGVASSDLLARIMGVDPVPDVPEARWLSAYQALIVQDLHAGPDGLALRARLDAHFGGDHPVMQECERMIRLQGFKQKLPRALGREAH